MSSKRRNKRLRNNKQRTLQKNAFDREELGLVGMRTAGELRRGRTLRADHKRNIAEQGGYPDVITLRQHYDMAYRNGIGSNLAFGIVNDSWRVDPVIYDGDKDAERRKDNPTEFEKAIDEHFERLNVFPLLKGLDIAQRPMRYGALVYVTSENDPGETKDKLEPLQNIEYLMKMNVFHEAQLQVNIANQDPCSINYGSPVTYNVRTNVAGSTNEWESSGYNVHASRVYAYGEGAYDGSIYGVPCNEGCFEALMDLAKVRMSGAEGFYQNASNKYAMMLPEGATAADATAILDSMDEFDNGISSSLIGSGSLNLLQTSLSDPTHSWTIGVNECAAHHDKPMTLVVGHQTGERASGEDIKSWNRVIMDRQSGVCSDMIKGLINDWIEKFNFPKPTNKINVVWRDLNESTAEQKADLAKTRAETNKTCIDASMQPIYSTEYMQSEAGAPVEEVVQLDSVGEDDKV